MGPLRERIIAKRGRRLFRDASTHSTGTGHIGPRETADTVFTRQADPRDFRVP